MRPRASHAERVDPMRPAADRIVAMRRSGIREVMDLAAGRPDVLHLEVGEPDFPTPAHIAEAGARAVAEGFTRYTPNRGLPSLVEAVREKLTRANGLVVDQEQVIVTAGGVNAIMDTLIALVNPGDAVLIPDPGWPNYEMMATVVRADTLRYPLDRAAGWEPDLDSLESLAAGATVLVVNSPSNPTGAVWRPETVARVVEIATRHDLWVVSDEVYEDIVFEGRHLSPATLAPERVVSVFSMSKSYAMTGWRIGYLAAPLTVAGVIAKVQEPVISCPTAMAQKAAEAALTGPQDCVARMVGAYRERRDLAVAALRDAGLLVSRPAGAFYALADVTRAGADTYAFARRLVAERGVAVAPGEAFGPGGAGLVRLSLAADGAVVAEGIRRLGAAVVDWAAEAGG